ncbi:SPOC like C-terminal domain-containing protein [Mycena rosella]|uniref:ATP-dependent DNA helicase II subunit 2 n=1 Tax=Mycena rosella TaxID=1033263 RepID=A0AAD7G7B1_MYCRO|nr:SPOC like C-terminal domain-containing protein [Mycena rosella]
MPAERAGYTVTMFVVDIGPTMAKLRTHDPDGNELGEEITNLQWGLQFVKLKIQEMVGHSPQCHLTLFPSRPTDINGRKTDQCGVIVFGADKTRNILNKRMKGGYDRVLEYIPVAQPNAGTLAKLDALEPSDEAGDPLDALIVAIETQDDYLGSKKTWTRKLVLVTDGESPIEVEDLPETINRINKLEIAMTIVGIDFDDEELPFEEDDKSDIKAGNEAFYAELVEGLTTGILGTCALALRETMRPDIRLTKSTLMGTTLRIGDADSRPEEAMEINIKTSKCTSLNRPKSWKKFGVRDKKKKPTAGAKKVEGDDDDDDDEMDVDEPAEEGAPKKVTFVQLKMRTEYYVDRRDHNSDDEGDVKMEEVKTEEPEPEEDEDGAPTNKLDPALEQVDKEELIRGFKYGTTYVPCPDGQFGRLPTKKGIDICGFFLAKNFRRELCLGEIQYVWGDPAQPEQEVAISSIAQAMYEKNAMAIARWVSKDGMDAKMGVLAPCIAEGVDCLLWAQMPFADDVRKYTFASLDNLVSKKGEVLTEHAYIPTAAQTEAMDNFVDAMDLMEAGEKDEEGNRAPWFDTRLSYNPAIHRIKQAQFHAAIVSDISSNPLPPPHPELLKYFDPPRRVLKRARDAIEQCKSELKVKQVPKKVAKARKDGHVHARDDDGDLLLLDARAPARSQLSQSSSQLKIVSASPAGNGKAKAAAANTDPEDSETEDDEEDLLAAKPKPAATPAPKKNGHNPLPTPARSLSPDLDLDPGRAPGRIIGNTRPLADFKVNIARGDMVSKAVEDLGAVVAEIVLRPFASRRDAELMECLEALRDTCLKEDEIDAWNTFLQDLREKCVSEPGNRQFWAQVQKAGRTMSLISDTEAEEQGGTSAISESNAEKFLE